MAERATSSGPDGRFQIANLPPGVGYTLRAAFPGYATIEIAIEIEAGRLLQQVIMMRPSEEMSEIIEIVGRSEVVEVDNPETTTTFDATFIEGLPVIGREYEDILVLAPGVTDEDGDGNVNIHGSRDRNVMTMIDGMDVTDPFSGKDPLSINIESIQELELVTAGAGAQYGGKSGGFINILTKSGNNDFAGAFKFFYRTDEFDGDGAGSDPPNFHGNPEGTTTLEGVKFDELRPFFSAGGPIVRNRLWYYLSLEYLDIDTPVNTVNHAFATRFEGYRGFGKLTWQASQTQKFGLSLTDDPFLKENLGVDSLTALESGFSQERERENLTLRHTWIASPRVLLETTASTVDYGFDLNPTLEPDRYADGVGYRRPAFVDRFDPDCTSATPELCDSFLDFNRDGYITDVEDPAGFFAARDRDTGEDFNGDGVLNPDLCLNHLGPGFPFCESDRNHNQISDPGDLDFHREILGIRSTSGPHFLTTTDERTRLAVAQTLSLEIDDFFGTHSIDLGAGVGREEYNTDIDRRNVLLTEKNGGCEIAVFMPLAALAVNPTCKVEAQIPVPRNARDLEAHTDRFGIFLNDRYQPIPNLTIGLGVRFDTESIDAAGFEPFDPAGQARVFSRVSNELASDEGLISTESLLTGPERVARTQVMRGAAIRNFTAHESSPSFDFPNSFFDLKKALEGGNAPAIRQPEEFTIENNNLSPRLSVAWDPWGTGKTKLFSTWGRYYDNIFMEAMVQEEAPAFVSRNYRYDYDGLPGTCDFAGSDFCDQPTDGVFNNHFGEKVGGFSPPTVQAVARDLKSPYADEFSIGFQREVGPELALGVTYVKRKWHNQLQDRDINHSAVDANGDGRFDQNDDFTGSLFQLECERDLEGNPLPPDECDLVVVNTGPRPDGLADLTIQNPFFNQILLIDNNNRSDYEAYELTLTRRLHRNWQMEASYTWSRAEGAAKDFLSELGNDPGTTEDEFGPLDFDQRHTVKISALSHLPKNYSLAGIATWSSGYPYSIIRERSSFDDFEYSQFRKVYPSGQRNDNRNDDFYTFSTSVTKSFVIGDISARLRFDIENLLNTDDLRVFDIDNQTLANQVRAERRFGRRYEIGLEMHF